MRLPENFDTTNPLAASDYSIDFAGNIPVGTTLVSVAWALSVRATLVNSTIDATPATRRIGDPVTVGTLSTQRIANLVAGNDYLVGATGTLSDGQYVFLWTILPCRAPG